MNTEKRFARRSLAALIVYWLLVAVAAWLLFAHHGNGGSGGGSGSGTSDSGTGSGAGKSGGGSGAGKTGTGSGAAPATTPKPASGSSGGKSAAPPAPAPAQPAAPQAGTGDTIPKKPPEEVASIQLPKPPPPVVPQSGQTSGAAGKKGFFGEEVDNRGRVIFLVDVSGSMSNTSPEGDSRIELLKRVLLKTLKEAHRKSSSAPRTSFTGRGSSGRFKIVAFHSTTQTFPPSGSSAKFDNSAHINQATAFVNGMSPCGGTNMLAAWKHILSAIQSERIDTVYFLSDGEPGDCNQTSLCEWLKTNVPKLKVHTFALGINSPLLKAVAAQQGGNCREIF